MSRTQCSWNEVVRTMWWHTTYLCCTTDLVDTEAYFANETCLLLTVSLDMAITSMSLNGKPHTHESVVRHFREAKASMREDRSDRTRKSILYIPHRTDDLFAFFNRDFMTSPLGVFVNPAMFLQLPYFVGHLTSHMFDCIVNFRPIKHGAFVFENERAKEGT
jgi:hypothetical protein